MIGDVHLDTHQLNQLQAAIVLPPDIHAAVVANPHLLLPLRDAIRKAVEVTFAHQQTKMRVITGNEVTRRTQLCLDVLQIAYAEQGFHILQMVDALPGILVDVIMKDNRGNEVLEAEHQQGRWTTGDGEPETEALCEIDGVLDDRMVAGDPDDLDEELADDEDMTDGVESDSFTDEEFDEFKEAQDA